MTQSATIERKTSVEQTGTLAVCSNAVLDGICRYCGKTGATVKTLAYWNQTPDVCHAECKSAGERQEAIDCQTIDADCNDCRHYQRGKLAPRITSLLHKPDGSVATVTHQPNIFIGGACLKFNKPTLAQPNKWTGHECFEHRRTK